MSHKATPEQWARLERWTSEVDGTCSCIIELRDRVAALEEPPQPEPTVCSAINALADRLAALESAPKLQQQDEDADRACPHIVTSDEGTSYCKLAEQTTAANHFPDATKMVPAPAIAWARQLPVHDSCHPNGCDICQRDWPCARLVAEQDARKMAPAPAGGLVERVAEAIATSGEVIDEARDAILAVADWLEQEGIQAWAADRLKEEVERG
jgi:hypothetical protein